MPRVFKQSSWLVKLSIPPDEKFTLLTSSPLHSNTCRHRKVKCDEAHPICQQCKRTGRYCDRAERELIVHESRLERQSSLRDGSLASALELPRNALQTPKGADFFQHYIVELAPWYDLSDAHRGFAVQVPVLALEEPLLFKALMALSAMHTAKTVAPSARQAAEGYHGECIRALINMTEDDTMLLESGVALVATCLLRSYEILAEDADPNRHLQGAYSLASQYQMTIGNGHPPVGGLLLSGFWNYLREDITFSLFGECPLKMDLTSKVVVPRSNAGTDHDHLNNISLILGNVINNLFRTQQFSSGTITNSCLAAIRGWVDNVPRAIHPFSRATARKNGQTLPSARFIQDCHASAWHYFLVALCIIASHDTDGFHFVEIRGVAALYKAAFEDLNTKDALLEAMATEICGIAFTASSPPVIVNAFGPISFCAKYIRDEGAQNDLLRHLSVCHKTIGWPVQRIVDRLRQYWNAELGQ